MSTGPFDGEDNYQVENKVTWARGRLPTCTYVYRTFPLNQPASRDHGQPARFVVKVFDELVDDLDPHRPEIDWTENLVTQTPGGRKQIRLMVAREAGAVREIRLDRVPTDPRATSLEHLLTLDRDASTRLIDLIRSLDHVPMDGNEQSVRIDDQTLRDLLQDPTVAARLYGRDPDSFRRLIQNDPRADDLIAIAHRREVVDDFELLLGDHEHFAARKQVLNTRRDEDVWQSFFEASPWILGASVTGQLLTSWNEERLEQVVAGFSIGGPGKRADAVLQTNGRIRNLVFAEIKHHRTGLLASSSYRSGCWAPSAELSGGVTQSQQTVSRAVKALGQKLPDKAPDGSLTGSNTYLVRPRSFLIVGHLDQLRGDAGGVHDEKFQCFELYRRNLYEPEIITFDELLARAQWHVNAACQKPENADLPRRDPRPSPVVLPADDPWSTPETTARTSGDPWG